MPDRRLVSVIIPAFNAERFIEKTLESVTSQTYSALEVIVVDDGSTDATASVVQHVSNGAQIPIRIFSQSNKGVSAARNRGVAEARGDLLAFLDADDLWEPSKVADQVRVLKQRSYVAGVVCAYAAFNSNDGEVVSVVHPSVEASFIREWMVLQGPGLLLPSTLMMRREAWANIGYFDEALSTAADLDFGLRLLSLFSVEVIDDVLVQYRLSPQQMHRNHTVLRQDYARLRASEFFEGDHSLYRRANANMDLSFAREQWNAQRSARSLVAMTLTCLRYPRLTMSRVSRRVRRVSSSTKRTDAV